MRSEFQKELRLLVVENNDLDAKLLRDMLTKSEWGAFEFAVAKTLAEAFHQLDEHKFDLIILDLHLADSNGIETLEQVHRRHPELPVVVNTGAYKESMGLRAVTNGAQDFLIKGSYTPYSLTKSLYYAIERKKAEDELYFAYNRLKETQSQLIQAEKMNVVGTIATGVAHEVKNPLATIIYGVEFLGNKISSEDPQVKHTLECIRTAVHKANDIIRDLLDFGNVSRLHKEHQDVNELIKHVLKLVRHQCDRSKIQIVTELKPDISMPFVDRNRIEQVLMDVLINAIHAMPEGGTLTVRTGNRKLMSEDFEWMKRSTGRLKLGDKVIIVEVDDTGKGIPHDKLGKIFDPFYTTRRAAGGVGLGLSIARSIMEGHDAGIDLQNLPGGGARARLVFRESASQKSVKAAGSPGERP